MGASGIKTVNNANQTLTLAHQDAGSSAGNKFILAGSANKTVPPFGTAELRYSVLGNNGWFAL